MKRLRLAGWSGQVLSTRPGAAIAPIRPAAFQAIAARRQSSAAASAEPVQDFSHQDIPRPPLPSPPPSVAARSAKLAALHARLSLSKKIPLETLARTLVTLTADDNANFNNSSLATLGRSIIHYHVLEYLVCKWPRLPMSILYAAIRAYGGPQTLQVIARRWGVESAAAPGEEVDPGLLQWKPDAEKMVSTRTGYLRAEDELKQPHWRRGMSSRIVLDDDLGEKKTGSEFTSQEDLHAHLQGEAFASFAQAVVGAVYLHCGREAAKHFVTSHILSRQVDLSKMFEFVSPTRELAMLCAREGFEAPIARLESETGRLSRTPVFVVGIYSGTEKLGEAAGPSLDMARRMASMAALKAWYLYSPGNKVRVPSDMMEADAKPWKAPHIDVGEIV
ncbi:hypothetical protein S7711_00738 [Stachybotrys chartarum IBT 7711]|uniref:Large ribosomal subunit protein mL44 n=1 Tax=Stachybotrys chartarum (strain CBS 109288 / IBT 7711) TaxID=1280523 RepID=A0A084B016_STACB|nr:hypothetical protein S7711_00738 [Stachybotrys chartarum IBT 7711]KFA49516.1 hypothetical protein S40293_02846 [Stachybotrys chartarum IBT 40293]KFA73606.1 hypothetical protein S40288_02568 [Stachybotrys chartarum IBT 40288]